ncbi:MAG: hypothetical protein JO359_13050 [Candidatus Eremiobacteraeota bacterium]|nr:hypothetical protein [Candidatus Eremiobacteraeota bacterium]
MKTTPNVMMAFACESASSEPGEPISFHHVLDGIEAAEFPAPTGRWFGVFCFYSPEEKAISNCRVVIEHESGEIVAQTKVKDLTFAADRPISRNMVGFAGFSWPYPGIYHVNFVAERSTVLATFPMVVQTAAQPEEGDDS